jgi:nucleotide-binding universal stress UspA family protein
MTIKDLLVHFGDSERAEYHLTVACELAKRHSARLTGLLVVEPTLGPQAQFEFAPGAIGAATGALSRAPTVMPQARFDSAAAKGLEARFLAVTEEHGIDAEWHAAIGSAATVADFALYTDLTIVSQRDPDRAASNDFVKVPEAVLLASGRPVLTIPYTGNFRTIGRRVMVAWKRGREAARAVNDAWPILAKADSVTLVAVNPDAPGADGLDSASRITQHLARHGVRAQVERPIMKDIDDATVLLNAASDMAADLIVAGGYGHSRIRELALGGVTRTLLNEMVAPILMSH